MIADPPCPYASAVRQTKQRCPICRRKVAAIGLPQHIAHRHPRHHRDASRGSIEVPKKEIYP